MQEVSKQNINYGFQSPEHIRFGDFVCILYKMPENIVLKNKYGINVSNPADKSAAIMMW